MQWKRARKCARSAALHVQDRIAKYCHGRMAADAMTRPLAIENHGARAMLAAPDIAGRSCGLRVSARVASRPAPRRPGASLDGSLDGGHAPWHRCCRLKAPYHCRVDGLASTLHFRDPRTQPRKVGEGGHLQLRAGAPQQSGTCAWATAKVNGLAELTFGTESSIIRKRRRSTEASRATYCAGPCAHARMAPRASVLAPERLATVLEFGGVDPSSKFDLR